MTDTTDERSRPLVDGEESPVDGEDLRWRVDAVLTELLDSELSVLSFLGDDIEPFRSVLAKFVLDGGKRLRPAFVYWGFRAAGGDTRGMAAEAAVRAGCAVELLHASALICDDVMDGSPVRRQRPAVHADLSARHRASGWRGDADTFGTNAAVVMGLLAFTWADVALTGTSLAADRSQAAWRVFNLLRTEVIGGQYLDLALAGRAVSTEADVHRLLRYKSGKYTVERPLHLGHAVAGGDPALATALSAYALPLGEAFQLRDDLNDLFGDPEVTGKQAGEDLRSGKQTYPIIRARQRAGPAGRRVLEAALGNPQLTAEELARVRSMAAECGALEDAEDRIQELTAEASATLEPAGVPDPARAALQELAAYVTRTEVGW